MKNKTVVMGTYGLGILAALVGGTILAFGGYIPRGGVVADAIMAAAEIVFLLAIIASTWQKVRPGSTLLAWATAAAQSDAIAQTFTTGCRRVQRAHRRTFADLRQRGAIGPDLHRGAIGPDLHRAATPTDRRGTGRQAGGSGTATRQAAGSKSDDDGGGEPPRPLLDQTTLAAVLSITKKTLQNQYSATPWLLPPAIHIPGARGPRWTPQSVQQWLDERPKHTPQTAPHNKTRKVGRPRIAYAGNGGAQ